MRLIKAIDNYLNINIKLLLYAVCILLFLPGCKEPEDENYGIEPDSIRVHGSLDSNLNFSVDSVYVTKNKSKECTRYHWQLGRRVSLKKHETTLVSPKNNQFDAKVPLEKVSLILNNACDWQLQEIIFNIKTKEHIQKASSAIYFRVSKYGIREEYPEKFDYSCKFKDVTFSKNKIFSCEINGVFGGNVYWLSDDYIKNGINIDIKLSQP